MGDIHAHAELSRIIIETFRQYWPHEENYAFFELGNWLTDMSQFNDPYACLCAKMRVWAPARALVAERLALIPQAVATSPRRVLDGDDYNLDQFADTMLGGPSPEPPGYLSEFLKHLSFCLGCEWFRRPPYSIAPAHFREIFNQCFTQYFPHEHLDFPPWPHGEPWGNRDPSTRAQHRCGERPVWRGAVNGAGSGPAVSGPARRTLAYLDDQIEYVAELLTWIEHEWIRVNAEPESDDNRWTKRSVLARWGHASHAIEDFFFHSNFVEFAWSSRHADGSVPTVATANHHRQRRVYWRRRRSPAWDGQRLSQTNSYSASRVYTGSFGGEDVYHTFIDALDGIPQAQLALIPGDGAPLIRKLASEQGRREMADRNGPERIEFLNAWRQYADGDSDSEIQQARRLRQLDRLSAESLTLALINDREGFASMTAPEFPWPLRGPFAFLTDIVCLAQAEHDASERKSSALDAARREAENASNIGPSAENIGCHSLMSKDSPRKPPLRPQAMALGAWVACYVARILAERLNQPETCAPRLHSGGAEHEGCAIDQLGAVDWLHLLQHFLCHPDECEQGWHLLPIDAADPNAAGRANLHTLTHHTVHHLTPSEVVPILDLSMRRELEREYRKLERDAEDEWLRRT